MSKKSNTKPAQDAQATKQAPETPNTVTLANLAREMNKNPKAVRSRFRKLYAPGKDVTQLPKPVAGGSRWTFAAKDREVLAKLIGAVDDSSTE